MAHQPLPAGQASWDVAPQLGWRSALWNLSSREFLDQAAEHGYRWSLRNESARTDTPIRFGALEIRSSELFFRRGLPVRWEWTLHDRAWHGAVPMAWIRERFAQATNAVQRWAGSAPMASGPTDGVRSLVWGRPPHIVTVEWTAGTTAAEAVGAGVLRLVVEPWPPRREWSGNVRSTENGDHFVAGVPMVDQRVQGHCAPATVERVMRYFGIPLEMSAMARLVESSLDAGTNVERMMAKIGSLNGMECDVREVLGFEVARFERTLRDYNAAAAGVGLPPVRWEPPVLDLARVFNAADPGLLRKVASRQRGKRSFERAVEKTVATGIPLVWGVVLGIVPETGIPAGTKGGHLRLILGYNTTRGEILYSDPWGAGHELKRMSCDDAWAMTISLHAIEPPRP